MEEIITSVGVPGILLILVVREILNFKFKKNGSNSCISRREFEEHKKSVRYIDTCDQIVNRLDQRADDRHMDIKMDLDRIEELIRNKDK